MTTAPDFHPTMIAVILITGRQIIPTLKPLVTRATVGLFVAWAVLALLASTVGPDVGVWNGFPLLDDAALVACYLGIASLMVKLPALLWLMAKSTTEDASKRRALPSQIARFVSIGCIAALIYIVSTHWS